MNNKKKWMGTILGLMAAVLLIFSGSLSESEARGGPTAEQMQNYMKAQEAAEKEMDLDEEALMEELKDLEPAERAERMREIRQEMEEIRDQKVEEYKKEQARAFFDDVEGDVAVYSRLHRGSQGVVAYQDDGFLVEFCYAESGCEDRSEIAGRMNASVEEGLLHASDPDKEVVGLKLRYKLHPDSSGTGVAVVAEGSHDPEANTSAERFEAEKELMVTETYRPGEIISYKLGKVD